jgi:putative acetyltransferase
MDIRRAIPTDREVLLDVWLRSVQATHRFVSDEDIQSMIPQVRDYLASREPEFWVLCDDSGVIRGFMGMSGSRMDSLFLTLEFQRRGAGRRLVLHAHALHGELTTDVNEQNPRPAGSTRRADSSWKGGRSATTRGGRSRCCTCGWPRRTRRRTRAAGHDGFPRVQAYSDPPAGELIVRPAEGTGDRRACGNEP